MGKNGIKYNRAEATSQEDNSFLAHRTRFFVTFNSGVKSFLTYQCLKDRIIPVLIHCRQNLSHNADLCEISVAIFEISYMRRSMSWCSKLSDKVGFLHLRRWFVQHLFKISNAISPLSGHLSWRLIWWAYSIGRPLSYFVIRRHPHSLNIFSSETTGPISQISYGASMGWGNKSLLKWFWFWFDFCFTALQHILGHFGHCQLT